MVSFTGSARGGRAVTRAAADGAKRVVLELGGKGPNLIFADLGPDLATAVRRGVRHCFQNSGQSCNAPTRMLVERSVYAEAEAVAAAEAEAQAVGDPALLGTHIGPLASAAQWHKVQRLIEEGIASGARLVAGGQCTNASMRHCAIAPMHQCTSAPMRQCTSSQVGPGGPTACHKATTRGPPSSQTCRRTLPSCARRSSDRCSASDRHTAFPEACTQYICMHASGGKG